MDSNELKAVFDEGERTERLVWLKHRFDPKPVCDEFCFEESGKIYVSLYFSGTDDYEGLMSIGPADVEWAHVSSQTYESVLRERLTLAEKSQTLVRVFFTDFMPPQLVKHYFHTSTDVGTAMFCFFMNEERLLYDSVRSRIPLKVVLNIENTSIPNHAVSECSTFQEIMSEPNLSVFWERSKA